MGESHQAPRWRLCVALGIVYLVWGSTYLAIRYGVASIPPLLLAGTRFVVAGAGLLAWTRFRGVPRATRREWSVAFRLGATLLFAANGGVTWAETRIPSGMTALIVASEPLWVAVLSWVWTRDVRPRWPQIVALGMGLAGVASLVAERTGSLALEVLPLLVLVASPICWALGSLYASALPQPRSPLAANGMMMLCGGGLLLAVGLAAGEARRLELATVRGTSWFALLYLIVAGSLIAFSAYAYLLRTASPALASTYAFVNPLVAVALGAVVAGEPLTGHMLVGMTLVVSAVLLLSLTVPAAGSRKLQRPSAVPPGRDEGISRGAVSCTP